MKRQSSAFLSLYMGDPLVANGLTTQKPVMQTTFWCHLGVMEAQVTTQHICLAYAIYLWGWLPMSDRTCFVCYSHNMFIIEFCLQKSYITIPQTILITWNIRNIHIGIYLLIFCQGIIYLPQMHFLIYYGTKSITECMRACNRQECVTVSLVICNHLLILLELKPK